jgi:hypothetical protein
MYAAGESEKGVIGQIFNRCVQIDFKGARITQEAGVLMPGEVDERFECWEGTGVQWNVNITSVFHLARHCRAAPGYGWPGLDFPG